MISFSLFLFPFALVTVLLPAHRSLSQSAPPGIISPVLPGSSGADRQSLTPAKTIANGDVKSFIKLGVIICMYKMALCWQDQSPGLYFSSNTEAELSCFLLVLLGNIEVSTRHLHRPVLNCQERVAALKSDTAYEERLAEFLHLQK